MSCSHQVLKAPQLRLKAVPTQFSFCNYLDNFLNLSIFKLIVSWVPIALSRQLDQTQSGALLFLTNFWRATSADLAAFAVTDKTASVSTHDFQNKQYSIRRSRNIRIANGPNESSRVLDEKRHVKRRKMPGLLGKQRAHPGPEIRCDSAENCADHVLGPGRWPPLK